MAKKVHFMRQVSQYMSDHDVSREEAVARLKSPGSFAPGVPQPVIGGVIPLVEAAEALLKAAGGSIERATKALGVFEDLK